MTELTCIVCPISCRLSAELSADGEIRVSGNRCSRGLVYATEEIRAPKRLVTATCRLLPAKLGSQAANNQTSETSNQRGLVSLRRLAVKSSAACPKDLIPALLADIYALEVTPPLAAGRVLIADWQKTGINIIATATVE